MNNIDNEGYILIKNFFDSNQIELFRKTFFKIFSNQTEHHLNYKINNDKDLINLYSKNKEFWVGSYDLLRYNCFINSLCALISESSNLFGIKSPVFASKNVVRCDMPSDDKFKFASHQDFNFNFGSKNSVTAWVPFQDTGINDGCLKIVPGSHINGIYDHHDGNIIKDDFEYIDCPMEQGDILVFSQFLVHKSGINSGNKVRFSLQTRFNDLDCEHFINNKYEISKMEGSENYQSSSVFNKKYFSK